MGRRSSPRGRDDSRGRSASRRSSGEHGGKKEQGSVSLLVRNIPHDCSSDLLIAFQKFGRIQDFYIPKDYHSGEPRGFAFIEFCDSRDASEAQRRMNRTMVCGREINVVRAVGKRKRPDSMSGQTGLRGHSDYKGRHLSRHGRSRSRSHSRSPRHGGHHRSRSHSPAPRRQSPKRKEECQTQSPEQSKEHDKGKKPGPCTPRDRSDRHDADNGSNGRRVTAGYSASPKRTEEYQTKSPRQAKKHADDKRQRSYTPADRNDCREARNGHDERDDYSTSPKRKEERLAKSPRLSKEHDKDKKRRSYSCDDGNDCFHADIGLKERRATTDGEGSCPRQRSLRPLSGSDSIRRDDYSASPKGKEEHQEPSPRHSKEYDKCKQETSDTPDCRNNRRDADHSHNEIQDDHPTSPKIKEEHQAKSSGESEEYDKDTKRRSYAPPHGRTDRHDANYGSKDSNVHVDRKPVAPDGVGSHASQSSPGPSTRSSSRRQDDCSTSAKRKEEVRAESPKQSNGHEDKQKRSYTPDDRNDRCDADNCSKKKQDDYPSLKRKEECQAKSPRQTKECEVQRRSYAPDDRIVRQEADSGYNERRASPDNGSPKRTEEPRQAKSQSESNEHDNDKKQRSYTRDDRKDRCNDDNGSKERNDYSASGNKKEEDRANFPRHSKEHDDNKKRGSFTPVDRNDNHDTDNGSKERQDDNSASRKRMEDHRTKSPTQSKEHENDKKKGSYTHNDRKDHCDADNGSRKRRDDYSASGNREERRAKSPRQSKEHDDSKKRGSFTPDDRNDHHDTDNGSKERRDDNSAPRKRLEDHHAKSPRQSKEHENDKKGRSYTHDDRKVRYDADNGSRERDDNSASRKRTDDHRAKSPRQSKEHQNDTKRGSYTRDERKEHCDADNGSRERDDYSASRKRKEESRGKSPRRSKEHDDNKRGSYAPGDRYDRHVADNGSNEKQSTHDRGGSHPSPRRRSARPSSRSRSRSADKTRGRRKD